MKIPLSSPDITLAEKKAVSKVLNSSRLSLGPKLPEFEQRFAKYIGRRHAVAVNSGTSALHLILLALDIKAGDEVITTPFSFVASANCILFVRAKPVFADIDPRTLNIDPQQIEKKITPRTKAILAVDVFGRPADWTAINRIARKYKLKVIEDSCEAVGSEYKGKKCGSFGDAATFAFYPNKQMTTGEGGMVVTDHKRLADLCRSLRNQGRDANGSWLEHARLGYNYRLSDINCALGIAQLERIERMSQKRRRVAQTYDRLLRDGADIELLFSADDDKINPFVYVIRLRKGFARHDRERILLELRRKGIGCHRYFAPIHLQPFYRRAYHYRRGDYPVTEAVADRTIALPFYNKLSLSKMEYVVANLKKVLKQAAK